MLIASSRLPTPGPQARWKADVTSPTNPIPPPTGPPQPGASPWLKLLLGCAVGCAVVGALVFLAVGGGMWWLVSPGEQVATEGVAGGESQAVVHFGGLNDDPGTRALLDRAVVAMQRAADRQRAEEMPDAVRWLEQLGRAQSGGATGLGMWIPRDVTVTVEQGEDGESVVLVALNLAAFPRMIRMMVRQIARAEDEGGPVRKRYRGYDIDVFPDSPALAFAGSTLLVASRPEAVRRAIDRLEDGPEPGAMAALLPADGAGRWDVHGAVRDHDGTLGTRFAEALPGARPAADAESAPEVPEAPEPAPGGGGAGSAPGAVRVLEAPAPVPGHGTDPGSAADEAAGTATPAPPVERLTFGVDVVTADRIAAEIRLDCASEAGAREWLGRLEESLRHLETEHGRGALSSRISGTVESARLRAEIELTGVDAWIESAAAEWMEEPPEDDWPAEPEDDWTAGPPEDAGLE